jgi:hypothetical protein
MRSASAYVERMRVEQAVLGGACLTFSCMCARPASAIPAPPDYEVTVDASTVEICIGPPDYAPCGSPMLRQDPDGTVVSLPDAVLVRYGSCYLDECVPSGTYRYGCETPLGCETPYWISATVSAWSDSDGGCMRQLTSSAPMPVDAAVSWPPNGEDTPACPQDSGGHGCSAAGPVVAFDGSVLPWALAPLWLVGRRRRARSEQAVSSS